MFFLVVPRPFVLTEEHSLQPVFISLGQVGCYVEGVGWCIELEVFMQALCGLFGTFVLFKVSE